MKKYLIAVALVLALVGTPVLAARDNTALINSLMQQVEQLMTMLRTLLAQQPTSTPAPISVPSSWKTYSGPIAGISFKYPNSLNPACAELQEPTVTVTSAGDSKIDSLGCLPASAERPIKSEKVTLNGINFCLSKGSDAGAGQLYRDYRYTTFKNNNYYTLGYVVHTSNGCGVFKNNNDVNSPILILGNMSCNVFEFVRYSIKIYKFLLFVHDLLHLLSSLLSSNICKFCDKFMSFKFFNISMFDI